MMQNQQVYYANPQLLTYPQIIYGPAGLQQPPLVGFFPPPQQPAPYNVVPNNRPPPPTVQRFNQINVQAPVFQQPQFDQFTAPQLNNESSGDASSLQALQGTDRIVVKQKMEMLEIFTSWEINNKYEIFNGQGQQIYYAVEDTSGMSMFFFGQSRPFCIRLLDARGQQVMVVNSSVDCCTREVTVELPPGRQFARIKQEFAFMTPSFFITDFSTGQLKFKVKSPMAAALGSFGNTNFDIFSEDQQTVVGQITKQWGGFFREAYTDADTFGLSVPSDMSNVWKAVLLAVTFVVDFEFYEKSNV